MTFDLGLILLKRFGQLLIICLILSAYLYEKHAHKRAVQEMATFKQQLHDADIAKQAENALKLKIAQKTIEDSAKVNAEEQAQILFGRENAQCVLICSRSQNHFGKNFCDFFGCCTVEFSV